jgi:hypothetical protein
MRTETVMNMQRDATRRPRNASVASRLRQSASKSCAVRV